jgi:hypothetical protein
MRAQRKLVVFRRYGLKVKLYTVKLIPGPEITPVVSVTFNCSPLATVVLRASR